MSFIDRCRDDLNTSSKLEIPNGLLLLYAPVFVLNEKPLLLQRNVILLSIVDECIRTATGTIIER